MIVLVGFWDTTDRRFSEWDNERHSIGDPTYDDWLLSEYSAAIDLLTSRGARVVWLTAPCIAPHIPGFGNFDPKLPPRLNRVLDRLAAMRGDELEVIDLFSKICPDGVYTNELAGMKKVRPDGVHLSEEAADWIADWLIDQIL